MAAISVIKVDDITVKGKFSVMASVDRTKNPPILSIAGMIETPTRLPDSFKRLEGGRIIVHDILIDSESAGSEDDSLVYSFSAKSYDILELGYKKKVISDG